MDTDDWLAKRFEEHRTHLRAVAYRILGSISDADDAVQEAWLRLARSDSSQVENLGGWLTTVVARVSLNMLQSRNTRREDPAGSHLPEEIADSAESAGPEHQAVLADAVGRGVLGVRASLPRAGRRAFSLHNMFPRPSEETPPIVNRPPAATRQLASRARRRVQGADTTPDADLTRQREVVQAFLAASRNGDLGALVAVLDPDVVVRADHAVARIGAEPEIRGTDAGAAMFLGRARGAELALINGVTGLVWAVGGRPRVVFSFTLTGGKITRIDLLGDPGTLGQLDLVTLPGSPPRDPGRRP